MEPVGIAIGVLGIIFAVTEVNELLCITKHDCSVLPLQVATHHMKVTYNIYRMHTYIYVACSVGLIIIMGKCIL